MKDRSIFTLKELLSSLQRCIDNSFNNLYWIKAEISDFKVSSINGHCYMELIEKGNNGNITAKVRANIWNYTFEKINSNFIKAGLEPLSSGLSILCLVKITYHVQYGLSLTIDDVDTQYSLGEVAKLKQETIKKLKDNGLYYLNKQYVLPKPIKRVALITSNNAAGMEDFTIHIKENRVGKYIQIALFQAMMQGNEVTSSVIKALESISKYKDLFDCVVIIRGGGAISELRAFDDYSLCEYVAKYPLPIISGIGHEKDVSVLDMIANLSLKTPTAVAEFLINNIVNELDKIDDTIKKLSTKSNQIALNNSIKLSKKINLISQDIKQLLNIHKNNIDLKRNFLVRKCSVITSTEKQLIEKKLENTLFYSKTIIRNNINKLNYIAPSIKSRSLNIINVNVQKLSSVEQIIKMSHPENILKKGYSLVSFNGKIVSSIDKVKEGDLLKINFFDGNIDVSVKDIEKK